MLLSTAMAKVAEVFPEAECDEDNYGQIIIYTGMRLGNDGEIIKFEEEG